MLLLRLGDDAASAVPVGTMQGDLRWRGVLSFELPDVAPGVYTTGVLITGRWFRCTEAWLPRRDRGHLVIRVEPRSVSTGHASVVALAIVLGAGLAALGWIWSAGTREARAV